MISKSNLVQSGAFWIQKTKYGRHLLALIFNYLKKYIRRKPFNIYLVQGKVCRGDEIDRLLQDVNVDSFRWEVVGGRLVTKCVRAVPALSWHGQRTVLTRLITNHFLILLRQNYAAAKAFTFFFLSRHCHVIATSHYVKLHVYNTRLILVRH